MKSIHYGLLLCGAAIVGAACWLPTRVHAELQTAGDFQTEEVVKKLTVKITLAADSGELKAPLALDLGLGFPLWLDPLGRTPEQPRPFGAVAQAATVPGPLAAGQSATYTFDTLAEPGQDTFDTTRQLLAGVRVSDISRIGFQSGLEGGWTLAGYEIQLNGRVLAGKAGLTARPEDAAAAAAVRLTALRTEVEPLTREAADIEAVLDTGLGSDAERTRLQELTGLLAPKQAELAQIEALLAGRFPWYVEPEFKPAGRNTPALQSARVTLFTASHAGADTLNRAYFRTGGHSFALNAADVPLHSELGPQVFQLDLLAGPLTAADLRGYGVGLLARPEPQGDVPDRWHPTRLVVEIDDRIVYDSDASPLDQLSLDVIRLVPPSQRSTAEAVVRNPLSPREVCFWDSGKGAGIDLARGGPAELPPPGAEGAPLPEPGLPGPGPGELPPAGEGEIPLFPGEVPPLPPGPPVPPPGWFEPGVPLPGPWDWLLGWLFEILPMPPGALPPPAGAPPQVDTVRIAEGTRVGDAFRVTWNVTGDAAAVDHFVVELFRVRPDHVVPTQVPAMYASLAVPAGAREHVFALAGLANLEDYVRASVTAVPVDPALLPHTELSPIQPLLPAGTDAAGMHPLVNYFWHDGVLHADPVSLAGEPPGGGRAVWLFGEETSHTALPTAAAQEPWRNVAFRRLPGDTFTVAVFEKDNVQGKLRVLANAGFLHGSPLDKTTKVRLIAQIRPMGAPAFTPWETIETEVSNLADNMKLLQTVDFDTTTLTPGLCQVRVWVRVEGGQTDPANPPAVFGLRIVPAP